MLIGLLRSSLQPWLAFVIGARDCIVNGGLPVAHVCFRITDSWSILLSTFNQQPAIPGRAHRAARLCSGIWLRTGVEIGLKISYQRMPTYCVQDVQNRQVAWLKEFTFCSRLRRELRGGLPGERSSPRYCVTRSWVAFLSAGAAVLWLCCGALSRQIPGGAWFFYTAGCFGDAA